MICCFHFLIRFIVSYVEVLKLRVILCLFIYLLVICLLLSWKEHKIKWKWNEKEMKIEINFTFVIWRNKSIKWKVCILFPITSIWLKFSFLIHCQRTFMGCNIIISNYYLITFEYEYLLLFVFESIIFEIQIKKYNEKLANINFTFF